MTIKITKTAVDRLSFDATKGNQQIYFDDELPGFGVRVTAGAKTFIAECRVNGKTRRVSIARYPKLTAEQARRKAKEQIGKMAGGDDPSVTKASQRERGVTLRQAFEAFLDTPSSKTGKKKKPLTVADYKKAMAESFDDWMDRPILNLSISALRARYSKRSAQSPARANIAFRVLRAVLKDAAAEMRDKAAKAELQDMVREALRNRWAAVEHRDTLISEEDLPKWVAAVLGARNDHPQSKIDVVSDYLMFCLLTGCRREEAATLRWADVNLRSLVFTLRDTKNRDDHVLPMSDWLREMFTRRKEGATGDFVFPGEGKTGHLVEPRKQMLRITKACGVRFGIHDLRRTFASIAESQGIGQYTLKRLMNHKVNNDVTGGYVVLKVENLREPMQRITDFVLRAGGVKAGAQVIELPTASRA
jgi:integrase